MSREFGGLWASLWMLLWLAPIAHAQDAGGFISPGPLAAGHQEIAGLTQCFECHSLGAGVSDAKCLDCHDEIRVQVDAAHGFHSDKGKDCASCHPDHRGEAFDIVHFDEEEFDHAETGFSLEGEHSRIDCLDCHEEDSFLGLERACLSCHELDDPHNHLEARPAIARCETCHGAVDWDALPLDPLVFDHGDPSQADYPLEGQHLEAECGGCHEDWVFVPVAAERCEDCHEEVHGEQFAGQRCEDCHSTEHAGFALPDYDHHQTNFPLLGQHRAVSCEACHGDGPEARYVGLAFGRCEDCHADPHEGQFVPRDCDDCHSLDTAGFQLADFDHDATDFPLRRAHEEVACADCHGEGPTGEYAALPFDDCRSCHTDPHEARFEPQRCHDCHLDGTWQTESFDHDLTAYPLTGAHVDVECESCHARGEEPLYAGLPHDSCLDCHAEEEPHEGHFEGSACTDCHLTESWSESRYEHLALTGFALEAAHALECAECHEDPTFRAASSECESCHERPEAHYEGACEDCHLPTTWEEGAMTVESHARTLFPLQGIHQHTACVECHAPGASTTMASPFCVDCHRSDDPHRNLLGDSCSDCHGAMSWTRTRFHHGHTGFPLRGAHRIAVCNDCHATRFAGTTQDCVRCHANERPNDSLHASPAVIAECQTCHRPYGWESVRGYPHGSFQ